MAEETGVSAPERDDTADDAEPPSSGDGDRRTTDRSEDSASTGDPNGSTTSTAAHATVTVDEAPSIVEAPPVVDTSANGTGVDADERSAAASRHPSMAQRLGLRTRNQLRARKVQRIVRRVDPWSVLKLSLVFYFCVWVMVIVAAVLLWGVAVGSGTVGSLESFIAEFLAFEEFQFNGDQLFQVFALGGLIGVFVATAVTAVLAVLFNLIADLTGGVRFTVVEEESARRLLDRR
jgi:hypothetical protein